MKQRIWLYCEDACPLTGGHYCCNRVLVQLVWGAVWQEANSKRGCFLKRGDPCGLGFMKTGAGSDAQTKGGWQMEGVDGHGIFIIGVEWHYPSQYAWMLTFSFQATGKMKGGKRGLALCVTGTDWCSVFLFWKESFVNSSKERKKNERKDEFGFLSPSTWRRRRRKVWGLKELQEEMQNFCILAQNLPPTATTGLFSTASEDIHLWDP